MSIKLRAWDHWNDEMTYSKDYDDLYDFFYDVKRRENGENKVSLMLASNQFDCEGVQIFEGDIIKFWHGDKVKTGIVECRPEHFCYWQVRQPRQIPGDHFGLGWVVNCCTGIVVTGNRYADREWLEDEGLGSLLDEASRELNRIDREFKADDCAPPDEIFADEPGVPKPAHTESDYRDDFGNTIKEGDILAFTLCGRRFTGEVLKIFSPEAAKSSWQVWTYESPKLKLSLLHMCEDVACSKVRVIGHISTVRQGVVAVQDIGITI